MTARGRRLAPLLVVVLSLLLGSLPIAFPGAAHAESVSTAQARVAELQKLQQETTRRLVDGTRRWEADRRAYAVTRTALRSTQRQLAVAQAELAAQQAEVATVARNLYRNPAPTGLQLALTRGPDEVLEAVQALGALNQAAGSQAQIIARASTARHRLHAKEREARRLERRAEDLVRSSAERLAELQALAQATADRLARAEDALTRARDAARRAALARASRMRSSSGGATCTVRSTAGQQNGNLDPASLCPLWGAPGHRLRYDAATAFNKLSQHHAATRGTPLCVTDSYRSYSEQASVYRRKPGLAAVPGRSNHGWGKAADLCGGVQRFGTDAYRWMKANAGRYGWFHPEWAEPSGSKPEAWHWEFRG